MRRAFAIVVGQTGSDVAVAGAVFARGPAQGGFVKRAPKGQVLPRHFGMAELPVVTGDDVWSRPMGSHCIVNEVASALWDWALCPRVSAGSKGRDRTGFAPLHGLWFDIMSALRRLGGVQVRDSVNRRRSVNLASLWSYGVRSGRPPISELSLSD
jgi:hypothetical protein